MKTLKANAIRPQLKITRENIWDTIFSLINTYFQEAFSQSDFQKGLELNKQIYKQDMHILHNYEKY
jgi:hypothetical protein